MRRDTAAEGGSRKKKKINGNINKIELFDDLPVGGCSITIASTSCSRRRDGDPHPIEPEIKRRRRRSKRRRETLSLMTSRGEEVSEDEKANPTNRATIGRDSLWFFLIPLSVSGSIHWKRNVEVEGYSWRRNTTSEGKSRKLRWLTRFKSESSSLLR